MKMQLPEYTSAGWRGGDPCAVYAFVDRRTGAVIALPVYYGHSVGPEVDVRLATRAEADAASWPAGWRTAGEVRS